MEVISKCCREGCGVKVSRQSGSVHSAHSVQSALYCKSLLINLMPLAELHSCLKSVTKMKTHNMRDTQRPCWSSWRCFALDLNFRARWFLCTAVIFSVTVLCSHPQLYNITQLTVILIFLFIYLEMTLTVVLQVRNI